MNSLNYAGFWIDPNVQALPLTTRAIVAYCISSPHTNSLGCFRLPLLYAAEDLNISCRTVLKAFGQAQQAGLIKFDSEIGWILIPSFMQWHKTGNARQWLYRYTLLTEVPKRFKYYPDLIDAILKYIPKGASKPLLSLRQLAANPIKTTKPLNGGNPHA